MKRTPLPSRFLILLLCILTLPLSGCLEFLFGPPSTMQSSTTVASEVATTTTTALTPDGDVSLPISYLDSSQMFVPAIDTEGFIPVVTFPESIQWNSETNLADNNSDGYYDDVYLSVSTDDVALDQTGFIHPFGVTAIFKSALADSSNVQLCPISTTNSVECFFDPQTLTPTQLHLAITNAEGDLLSQIVTENIESKIYYLRKPQSDILFANEHLYAITENLGVDVTPNESLNALNVSGDYNTYYKAFETDGTNLVYDAANDFFATLNSATGITVQENLTSRIWVTVSRYINGDVNAFTAFKPYRTTIYFGIQNEASSEAYLYNLYDDTGLTYNNDLYYDTIPFIVPGDLDIAGQQLTHTKTTSFTINDQGYALVVYNDANNLTRLRAAGTSYREFGLTPIRSPLVDAFDLTDIEFFGDDRALIVDNLNNRLWIVGFDPTHSVLTQILRDSVAVGNNPIDLNLNSQKSRAYILNVGDESISVINLVNSDGSKRFAPQVVATILLNSLYPSKGFQFSPNALTLSDASLFVGSQNTKAILEIPLSQITETSLADEDYDNDGFTSAQGDCSDNRARINPSQSEVCGDELDNNCDGSIDENCDFDGDGYTTNAGDCNDLDASISPGVTDVCEDQIDNNCDGEIDDNCDDGVSYF